MKKEKKLELEDNIIRWALVGTLFVVAAVIVGGLGWLIYAVVEGQVPIGGVVIGLLILIFIVSEVAYNNAPANLKIWD